MGVQTITLGALSPFTGYIPDDGVAPPLKVTTGDLKVGWEDTGRGGIWTYRAFIELDLLGGFDFKIPKGHVVQSVKLDYNVVIANGEASKLVAMLTPPSTLDGYPLLDAIAAGALYASITNGATGAKTVDLGSQAVADLQAAVDAEQQWFALGAMRTSESTPNGVWEILRNIPATPTLSVDVLPLATTCT